MFDFQILLTSFEPQNLVTYLEDIARELRLKVETETPSTPRSRAEIDVL